MQVKERTSLEVAAEMEELVQWFKLNYT